MSAVEVEGDTIDAAIETALDQLGVERDRVSIEILSNSSRGFLGIGGKKAKVRARLRNSVETTSGNEVSSSPSKESHRPERGDTNRDRDPLPPLTDQQRDELCRAASTVTNEIIGLIGVSAEATAEAKSERLLLTIEGDKSGLLIGRKGQTLDALEYIVARIVAKQLPDQFMHIAIDSNGYREKRRENLQSLAKRMAHDAKKKRKVITLNEMSARDRRIVHLTLQEESGITTRSSGQGHPRKLLIVPEGAERRRRRRGENRGRQRA